MGQIYTNGTEQTSRDYFRKKLNYEMRAHALAGENLINFHFAERLLYGRVNRNYVPMVYNPTLIQLKKFTTSRSQDTSFSAINFVVDAFEGLSRQFQKCAQLKKIDTSDPFLTSLRIYKAYENPKGLYDTHRRIYMDTLRQVFRSQNLQVKDFNEFTRELLDILSRTAKNSSFTMPGYIKSKRCPITVSGLAIEIADLDPRNDEEKINKFINSKNWGFYVNACSTYGFMIDEAVPWRLVADIGSFPHKSAMFEYAENYGLQSTNNIIATAYNPAHLRYYPQFKSDMLKLYNVVRPAFVKEVEERCGSAVIKKTRTISYTEESLSEQFSEAYFMKLYFQIRFYEEESQFTEQERELLMADCEEIRQLDGTNEALRVFERILNKTFDYNGSLSYISKRIKLIKDGLDDQ